MPLDLTAVAEAFQGPLLEQATALDRRFLALSRALARQADAARELERATRSMPLWGFTGGALEVRVEAPPLDRSGLDPQLLAQAAAAPGRRLLEGLGLAATVVEADLAVPRLLVAARDVLDALVAPMRRFEQVTPALFDVGARRLWDLPAIGALGLRALHADAAGLAALPEELLEARVRLEVGLGLGGGAAPASAGGPAAALADLVRLQTGLVLLVPAAAELLALGLHDVSVVARRGLLDALVDVEATVLGVRRTLLLDVAGLFDVVGVELVPLEVALVLEPLLLGALSALAPVVDTFATGLRATLAGVVTWADWVLALLAVYRGVVDTVLDVDLVPLLLAPAIGQLPAGTPLPSLTVRDLVGVGADVAMVRLQADLHGLLLIAHEPLRAVLTEDQIAGLHGVVFAALTPRRLELGHGVPRGRRVGAPDVMSALFGGGRQASVQADVHALLEGVRGSAVTAVQAAASATGRLGVGLLGDPAGLGLRAPDLSAADRLADQAFGARPAGRTRDPLAEGFEDALVHGGFEVVAGVVPHYVAAAGELWAGAQPAGELPTSPHLLLRRALTAGLSVDEVTVDALGHDLDGELAELVAGQLQERLVAAAAHALGGRPSGGR